MLWLAWQSLLQADVTGNRLAHDMSICIQEECPSQESLFDSLCRIFSHESKTGLQVDVPAIVKKFTNTDAGRPECGIARVHHGKANDADLASKYYHGVSTAGSLKVMISTRPEKGQTENLITGILDVLARNFIQL